MSIPVDLTELVRVLDSFDYAYLTTTDGHCQAHVVAVAPVVDQDCLMIADVGRRSRANAAAHPQVTLVWPPADRSGYTLIVDATCTTAEAASVRVVPTRAVLHRPAPPKPVATSGCGSDCVEVTL